MKCLILSGPPGAGKTTFGQLAAKRWGWEFLEKDRLAPLPDKIQKRLPAPVADEVGNKQKHM